MEPTRKGDKEPVQDFADDEILYRRFSANQLVNGEVLPTSIDFDEPPSFCRSKWAGPEDTIHRHCANNRDVSSYGVFGLSVLDVKIRIDDSEQAFEFYPLHAPLEACYAHSELRYRKNTESSPAMEEYKKPNKKIRNNFRMRVASKLRVVIEPAGAS